MFAVRILFIFAPFVCCNCYSRRVLAHDAMMNKNFVEIINRYIKPLSEKFPNHELEVQVDIQGSPLHHISQRVSRRKIHLRKPSNVVRAGVISKVPRSTKPKATVKTTTPSHSTYPLATKAAPTTPHVENTTTTKKEPGKQLVYKDDLEKALDELEKKINTNLAQKGTDAEPVQPQLLVSNSGPVHGDTNQNINRIIELIRKGIHFQNHVPNTDDGNMEWMQIKIPKSLNNDNKFQLK